MFDTPSQASTLGLIGSAILALIALGAIAALWRESKAKR